RYALYLGHGRHYADRPMKLVDQWAALQARLPKDWEEVRLRLTTDAARELSSAAAVLGPLGPGRADGALVFPLRRRGAAGGPEAARRLFARLDSRRIWCLLARDDVREAAPEQEAPRRTVAASWEDALALLPADWTEL